MTRVIARASLWYLAAMAAVVGLLATIAPRSFYDDFPFGAAWVSMLPPYNQHLISDVGGFYLAFALLFAWAAVTLRHALVVPLCVAWALAAVIHFGYHVTHLDGWDAGDAVAQTVALAVALLLPVAAATAVRRIPEERPSGDAARGPGGARRGGTSPA
jgi:hypothetical protein